MIQEDKSPWEREDIFVLDNREWWIGFCGRGELAWACGGHRHRETRRGAIKGYGQETKDGKQDFFFPSVQNKADKKFGKIRGATISYFQWKKHLVLKAGEMWEEVSHEVSPT